MQYLRLILAYLVPIKTWLLFVNVLFSAPTALIQSSYDLGADASLCIRVNLSDLEFLKAKIWKHLNPLIDLMDAKNFSDYIISFMRCSLRANTLVL